MKKISVAIVDDHTLLLQAIGDIVNSFNNFKVSCLCKNGKELIEEIKLRNIPDLVLMDVNMPIMNGIETTQFLFENYPEIRVLALTVEEDENTILKMIRAGAKGYLLKDTDKQTLEKAMIKTVETGYYHSNNISEILSNSFCFGNSTDNFLKENELAFLKLACSELTYKEIADKMHLSPKTIDGYRDNLFLKLNVKNRIGLVLYAIKNKIHSL